MEHGKSVFDFLDSKDRPMDNKYRHGRLRLWLLCALFWSLSLPSAYGQQIKAKLAVSGLDRPVFLTAPDGDAERVFIGEQFRGWIRVVKNGQLLPTPFLDLSTRISTGAPQQGLASMAFHPHYAANGYFFVHYLDVQGNNVVARYQVSAIQPDIADAGSAATLFTLSQPSANHNAGTIAFSPIDGYLYIALGDGVYGGDPNGFAQDRSNFYGTILRIDVDGGNPYAIPSDNPYVGSPVFLEEIWAYGLRNPWKMSFDRIQGDLYISDVGEHSREELSIQSAASLGGENYGWNLKEGSACFNPPSNCDPGTLTDPIYDYAHGGPSTQCAIIGGYVYQGQLIPGLQGTYLFADYCSANVWSFRWENHSMYRFKDRSDQVNPRGKIGLISAFGEDGVGELYICDFTDGEIYMVRPDLFKLEISNFQAGQTATATASQATPLANIHFFFSRQGLGFTDVHSLGVTLGLNSPTRFRGIRANSSGEATAHGHIPFGLSGHTLWMQAAEKGNTSNIVVMQIP